MTLNIISVLRSKSGGEAARLIGNSRTFIKNDNLNNLLQNYDLNDKKNDKMLHAQIQSFEGVPGLKDEVKAWLAS